MPSRLEGDVRFGSGMFVLLGLPIAAALAWTVVSLWASAASVCGAFEAGGRAWATLVVFPLMGGGLWLAWSMTAVALRRRGLATRLMVSFLVIVLLASRFLGGTREMINGNAGQADYGSDCASGLPDWWPSWIPG